MDGFYNNRSYRWFKKIKVQSTCYTDGQTPAKRDHKNLAIQLIYKTLVNDSLTNNKASHQITIKILNKQKLLKTTKQQRQKYFFKKEYRASIYLGAVGLSCLFFRL